MLRLLSFPHNILMAADRSRAGTYRFDGVAIVGREGGNSFKLGEQRVCYGSLLSRDAT